MTTQSLDVKWAWPEPDYVTEKAFAVIIYRELYMMNEKSDGFYIFFQRGMEK